MDTEAVGEEEGEGGGLGEEGDWGGDADEGNCVER